jgi:hypothetical protein
MADRKSAKKDIEIDLGDYEKRLGRESNAGTGTETVVERPTSDLSWGGRLLKRILLLGNIFFVLSGVVIFSLGAYTRNTDVQNLYPALANASMVVGVFMCIVGGMGICGSAWENRALLGTYMMVIGIFILIILISAIIVLSKVGGEADLIDDGWMLMGNGGRVALQQAYGCCGLFAYNDSLAGQPCPANSIGIYNTSCIQLMASAFRGSFKMIGTFALIVGIIMTGLAVLGYFLIRNISRSLHFSKNAGDAVMLMNITS